MLTPLFAILASCDQTATDLGTRHIRFLIPRVGRAEIFIARLVGAAIVMSVAQLLAGVAATIVALVVHGGGETSTATIVGYGAQVTGFLIVYSLPIVALMSLVSAAMASVGLALLVGLGGYAILGVGVAAGGEQRRPGDGGQLRDAGRPQALPAAASARARARRRAAGALAYVALYAFLGWQVFRTRGRLMAAAPIVKTEGLGRDFGGDPRAQTAST
jgi:hypothetical protein